MPLCEIESLFHIFLAESNKYQGNGAVKSRREKERGQLDRSGNIENSINPPPPSIEQGRGVSAREERI